ncbi:MAG: hypothetical protein LBJ57_05795 [Prevotellaceae bacterium]|jgi:hypothetical protein|nr:hypothetical protein [Prevotellaceae bacterium]
MIAEEPHSKINSPTPLTEREGATINILLSCMEEASAPFKKAYGQSNLRRPLNENKLTQIFVEQIDVKIGDKTIDGLPIGVKNHYSDIFFGTKGIPDFYFHKKEEGVVHTPLFVVEAKILPSPPPKGREKEYVCNNNCGGIERFKTEKHGKGLSDCGIVGFVEKKPFAHWLSTINGWIIEQSNDDKGLLWQQDEILSEVESKFCFMALKSAAHRASQKDVRLHHLWIDIQ